MVVLFAYHHLSRPIVGKEVDDSDDFWADHDSNVGGDPEDLMDDPNYEDGFIMSCCDKRPYEPGCVISRHKPSFDSQGPAQRVRR
jgi:hypothetical protein